MSENHYLQYDWILSLLAQKIAADVMIQEGAISTLSDSKVLIKGLHRCQLHARLLHLVLQTIKVDFSESRSTNLVKILQDTRSASIDLVKVEIERSKPMLNVLANTDRLKVCLRIITILLLLEDSGVHRILVSLRCRNGYVSVRFKGGKVKNLQLLDQELIGLVSSVLRYDGASLDWKIKDNKRLVYLRLNLSNQLNLIE
jgi:hypothetical protein